MQIFGGIFIFDMPGLNMVRRQIVKWLVRDGPCIISRHGNFYVPHGMRKEKVTVGNRVRISENVAIDCNGQGAIVGAGSAVVKNVDDYLIVAGNPAKVIGSRKKEMAQNQT